MGQYYRFINRDRHQESTIALPFNFGLSWAKDLDRLSSEQVKAQFDYVLAQNGWSAAEDILAIGDYGSEVSYPDT
jgi:hypothetical protein